MKNGKSAAHMETPYYDGYIKLHELIEKESQNQRFFF